MRKFFAEVYGIWISENPGQLAAALAYYGMFSFAPVIYIGLTIAGIFIDQVTAADQFYIRLQNLLGTQTAEQIRNLILTIANGGQGGTFLSSLISFLALFYAASGLFFQIQFALNMIWRVPPPREGYTRKIIRKRLFSFIMVIGVGLLLILATLVNLALAWFSSLIELFLGSTATFSILTWAATIGLIALSFGAMYKVLPDVRISWRNVWPGALVAAILIMLGGMLATLYFRRGSLGSALEAAGAVAILLLVINYSAQIFLLGAVITRVVAAKDGSGRPGAENPP
jgi:membrane protein